MTKTVGFAAGGLPLPVRVRAHEGFDAGLAFGFGQQIGLVQHQPARLAEQRRIVFAQFLDDRVRVGDGIGVGVHRRNVDEVQQQPRALQVARNWWPSPAPSAAPSIRPGMSAITKLRFTSTRTTPRCGCRVVKG